jgi:hypothetical protein
MTTKTNKEVKHTPVQFEVPALDIDAVLGYPATPQNKLERRVAWNLIHHLEANGFQVSHVDDRDDVTKVATAKQAMELIFNLDEAILLVRKPGGREYRVLLIPGNGVDLISDWNYTSGDPDRFNATMDAFDPECCA